MENIADKVIKKELGKKYINQREFAKAVGVTPQTVTRWRKKGIIFSVSQGKMNLVDSVFVDLLKNKNFDGAKKITQIFKEQERQTRLDI